MDYYWTYIFGAIMLTFFIIMIGVIASYESDKIVKEHTVTSNEVLNVLNMLLENNVIDIQEYNRIMSKSLPFIE